MSEKEQTMGEKSSRFEEGKSVDVGKFFRDRGNPEAAEEWEKYEGEVEKLKKAALARALANVGLRHPEHRQRVASIFKEALGWSKLPKGWTQKSVEKYWSSMTGDRKHKVTKCMKDMDGKVSNPGAFCGSLNDMVQGTTSWRGKDR